ncbi:MAG TPA: HD-GYP domain-containing protein [Candidatus Brocadiaceae bacterium]|nr:HD-GYP domain-containing protein [Candidatus Brocadiaceae bacterium]
MRRMHIQNVTPGMVLGKAIYGDNYEVLLNKGVVLIEDYINRLKNRGFIKVYIDDEETADVVIKDPISDKIRIMATKDILKTYELTQSAIVNIEAETTEAVIKSINTPKIKNAFQESQPFKQMCKDINSFVDELMNENILSGLNSIRSFDNYTFEHSVDTAVLSIIIAKRLFLNKDKLRQIAIGEFLHDIGKIFIDEKIINKPGKLTAEEYEQVKQHTTYGYELLKDIDNIGEASRHIPYQHHERQDGKGYPRCLRGNNKIDDGSVGYAEQDKMIMIAEIAAIADVYDACISDRPYRKGLSPDFVYELIKNGSGTQFNRELVDCFLGVMPKYPVGSEVRIKNGIYKDFTGVVMSLNIQQLSKPKVKLLCDAKKNKIKPFEIDLSSDSTMDMECVC